MRQLEILGHNINFWLKPLDEDEKTNLELLSDDLTAEYISEQIMSGCESGELCESVVDKQGNPVECTGEWYIYRIPVKDIAIATAYFLSHLEQHDSFFNGIDKAYDLAEAFVEKYPADTKWGIEEGLEYEETLYKFLKETP